jgi:hypothetical protein
MKSASEATKNRFGMLARSRSDEGPGSSAVAFWHQRPPRLKQGLLYNEIGKCYVDETLFRGTSSVETSLGESI